MLHLKVIIVVILILLLKTVLTELLGMNLQLVVLLISVISVILLMKEPILVQQVNLKLNHSRSRQVPETDTMPLSARRSKGKPE